MAGCLRHRRHEGAIAQPPPLVRVLTDPSELDAAIGRAIEFEQGVAARAALRIAHYEEISGHTAALVPPTRLEISDSLVETATSA